MVKQNDLVHDSKMSDEVRQLFPLAHYWGENIGVGPDALALHNSFMNSTPHRRNILYPPFRKVGMGLKKVDGILWVCVRFVHI